MKFIKTKAFIICAAIALVLVLIPTVLSAAGRTDILRSAAVTVAKPFSWCATQVAEAVNGFTSIFTDYDELKAENEKLKEELESLRDAPYNAEVVQNENEWLKQYLNFNNEHPEFVLTDARIIARESGNFATVLTLNRGKAHGIKKNMPVIAPEGLFGYVSEVGIDWCRVRTVVETASSVGVYTDRTGATGVVEGDLELRDGGKCRMTYIEADADIRVGDKVYTSGEGSIYPSGLLLGTISAIEADEASRTLVAEITPAVDFTDINDAEKLVIICGYVGYEEDGDDK